MTETAQSALYALVVSLHEDAVVLPNAALAEVVARDRLRPRADSSPARKGIDAAWVGHMPWQEYEIPVLSFEVLNGKQVPALDHRRIRLVVLHTIGSRLPGHAWALLAEGHPQMTPIAASAMQSVPLHPGDDPKFVFTRARIAAREMLIPNLERIETELAFALDSIDS